MFLAVPLGAEKNRDNDESFPYGKSKCKFGLLPLKVFSIIEPNLASTSSGLLIVIGIGVALGVALGIILLFGILFCLRR